MTDTPEGGHEDRIRNQAQLFDTPTQAVIGTTLGGIITYWSGGATSLYGWQADDVLGRDIIEVTPAAMDRGKAHEIMDRLRSGRSWTGQFPVQTRDGIEFAASVQNIPVSDEQGHLVGVIGVSTRVR